MESLHPITMGSLFFSSSYSSSLEKEKKRGKNGREIEYWQTTKTFPKQINNKESNRENEREMI